jgi:asparagine synthetase A
VNKQSIFSIVKALEIEIRAAYLKKDLNKVLDLVEAHELICKHGNYLSKNRHYAISLNRNRQTKS